VRASILHRLRAKSTQASPRRILQMDIEQTARPSPRLSEESREQQQFALSPKLTARLEGLLRAAQTSSVPQQQIPFRGKTVLPVLQEEDPSRMS